VKNSFQNSKKFGLSSTDIPLLRWDNNGEFRSIVTYPHHHHDAQGKVQPSPLIGDPASDIQTVLTAVAEFLVVHQAE